MNRSEDKLRTRIMHTSIFGLVASVGGAALIMTASDPLEVGLLGLIGFFLVIYVGFFSLFLLVYALRQHQSSVRFRSILRVAILALAPVMLLALSSSGQLKPLDILVVLLFEIAAIFYISRIT